MRPESLTRRSPDGRIAVHFCVYEARMSHWVLEPVVVRARDEWVVASLEGSGWDGGGTPPSFPQRDQVELHLRRYPDGLTTFDVVLDVEAELWWPTGEPESRKGLPYLHAELERSHEAHVEASAPEHLSRRLCPNCQARLYPPGRLGRLVDGDRVECLVCGRSWSVPR